MMSRFGNPSVGDQMLDTMNCLNAIDEGLVKVHRRVVKLVRTISVFLLILSLSLGSAMSVSLATQQAFAPPCPMEQKSDCPCCKDHCDSAIMSCSIQLSVPGAGVLAGYTLLNKLITIQFFGLDSYFGSQFVSGPPPPIPI